jgi:hypothetical protein
MLTDPGQKDMGVGVGYQGSNGSASDEEQKRSPLDIPHPVAKVTSGLF